MSDEAANLDFDDFHVGDTFVETYVITAGVYQAFLAASGDLSPVHVDDAYAHARGFTGNVMHGAILNAFLSHFVGMRVPGRRALLQRADMQYIRPSYLGDSIRLRATVAQAVEAVRSIVMHVEFENDTRAEIVARGRVQVGVAA